jgi:hypothetical protein
MRDASPFTPPYALTFSRESAWPGNALASCSRPARSVCRKASWTLAPNLTMPSWSASRSRPRSRLVNRSLVVSSRRRFSISRSERGPIEGHDLGRTLAHAVAEVLARNDEIAIPGVPAAQHNAGVGMAGVVPVEPGVEVLLHSAQQPAGKPLQLLVPSGVLRRDDEAKLMPVAVRPSEERLSIRVIVGRIVELSRQPFAGDAVALDVAQVSPRRLRPLPPEASRSAS